MVAAAVAGVKGLSALEKIAREIRRIKTRSRVVGEEEEKKNGRADEEDGLGEVLKRSKSSGGTVVR